MPKPQAPGAPSSSTASSPTLGSSAATRLSKLLCQLCFILLAALTMLGAADPSTRFDRLGHQLMCTCGCGEILLECNHVGCPVSGPMITELHNGMAAGLPNRGILDWFASRYGATVLAAPIRGGFDLVAWIMPFAVLALGIGGVILLIRLWHARDADVPAPQPVGTASSIAGDLRDRIRRETNFEP